MEMIKKITLTPLAPYFFGGENIFNLDEENKHYFIRSLETPSQTTLFGALRFIGIEEKRADYHMSEDDKKQVGKESYKLDGSIEDFGRIKGISPLYLQDQNQRFYIRTPFDHIRFHHIKNANGKVKRVFNQTYAPFTKYEKFATDNGERCLPVDYKAKDGITNNWLCLSDASIWGDWETPENVDNGRKLFCGVVQTISQKDRSMGDNKRFAKKEYKVLSSGFSFVFFATVDKDFIPHQKVVYLGQGKSAFRVKIEDDINEPEISIPQFNPDFIYAQSDIYYPKDISRLNAGCKFVCVQTRDFRVFTTNYEERRQQDRFNKSARLKLIKAGSVFWPNNLNTFDQGNPHAEIVGLNRILIGGKNI